MASVGTVLRSEREQQGRAIEDIAQELCLMPSYLRAIEADDLKNLPGTFFYKSFVRQYANFLGVSLDKLQADIQVLTALAEPETVVPEKPIRVPDPIAEAANRLDLSSRSWAVPMAALLVALVGGGGFYAWWKQPAAVPAPIVVSTAPASPEPTVNVTTTTGADGIRRIELNLSASEETWLSISSGGKQIFAGVLEPDETKTVSGLEMARLLVGNAGGLNVQWNGKEIGPIGGKGQVRVVVFTPEGFNILPSGSETSEETI
ncbi:MAG: RodZ domain-containing protein [Bryobacteraceae bacterium]